MKNKKKKNKKKLFELISENYETEVSLDEMNLFISLFLEINKNKINFSEKEIKNDLDEENITQKKIRNKKY